MAKKEIKTLPNKYIYITVKDNNGFERKLELLPGYTEEDLQAELKFRCQNVSPVEIVNERTIKSIEGLYDKIYNAETGAELLHLTMRMVTASLSPNFKCRYLTDILIEKQGLCEDELEAKTLRLAIQSLKEKGVIPKKLKVCYELSLKEEGEPID